MRIRGLLWTAASVFLFFLPERVAAAACEPCKNYAQGVPWGAVGTDTLTELSGLAASRRNPGVVWVHNDGSRRKVYALSTNATLLATFDLGTEVVDLEDIAVGPGPQPGVSYLYVGDIGGNSFPNEIRSTVRVFRIPEPVVSLAWASNPRSQNFDSIDSFELEYPDGSYEAEALMLDPLTKDLVLATKQPSTCRLYRAQLPNIPAASPTPLSLLRAIGFGGASAADISPDGTRIIIRREELAMAWPRCNGEPLLEAFGRNAASVPVIGPPNEPNGEAIGFLSDFSGYMTVSEGLNPVLHFFASVCPMPPLFRAGLTNLSTYAGATVELAASVAGYPPPVYEWRFNGQLLAHTGSSLVLTGVTPAQAGQYQLTAVNDSGSAASTATLEVRPKPDVRITEVQSSTAPSPNLPSSDWWELTSFEPVPVDLMGWKFNDNSGGLTDPFVFTNAISVAPGESIVFVEKLTPDEFRAWWGIPQLPPSLQVVTYEGPGLSFSATGDGIRLWSSIPSNEAATVASVDFGAAANGVTFNYNPATGTFGTPSVLGVNGVVKAAASEDIGSPGRIQAPPPSPSLKVMATNDGVAIRVSALAGYRYRLESRGTLLEGEWMPDGDPIISVTNGDLVFDRVEDTVARFYRVRVY